MNQHESLHPINRFSSSSTEHRSPVREGRVRISPLPVPLPWKYARKCKFFFINWGLWITLSPEQRLACQRTFIVSTEIHYNINNCAFPAKLDSYHTSAVDPVLGTQKFLLLGNIFWVWSVIFFFLIRLPILTSVLNLCRGSTTSWKVGFYHSLST